MISYAPLPSILYLQPQAPGNVRLVLPATGCCIPARYLSTRHLNSTGTKPNEVSCTNRRPIPPRILASSVIDNIRLAWVFFLGLEHLITTRSLGTTLVQKKSLNVRTDLLPDTLWYDYWVLPNASDDYALEQKGEPTDA